MALSPFNGSNQTYLERTPEKLVVEGYRYWTSGFDTGSIQPWELAWDLYNKILGPDDAGQAVTALSGFVRTLKTCAACPLRSFPFQSRHLCIEECLTIGLLAGVQNGDDAAELCLQHLSCPQRCHQVEAAAQVFGKTLLQLNQRLLPVPCHVINDVLKRQNPIRLH
ncbi:MAG: hypothetical protein AAFQ10_10720 [Pseudomonadota bacterium]